MLTLQAAAFNSLLCCSEGRAGLQRPWGVSLGSVPPGLPAEASVAWGSAHSPPLPAGQGPLALDSEADEDKRGPGALRVLLIPWPLTSEALGASQEPSPLTGPQSLGFPLKQAFPLISLSRVSTHHVAGQMSRTGGAHPAGQGHTPRLDPGPGLGPRSSHSLCARWLRHGREGVITCPDPYPASVKTHVWAKGLKPAGQVTSSRSEVDRDTGAAAGDSPARKGRGSGGTSSIFLASAHQGEGKCGQRGAGRAWVLARALPCWQRASLCVPGTPVCPPAPTSCSLPPLSPGGRQLMAQGVGLG